MTVFRYSTHWIRQLPFHRFSSGALIATAFALASCGSGGGGDSSVPPVSDRPVAKSDIEIAQMLYADSSRTPQGFYQDTAPSGQGYVATTHLKNADLVGMAAPQYELCTDDWNTALAWSDQLATGAQASSLVETNTTTRYYEFGRLRDSTPDGYIRARVYRCSYLDRSGVDLRVPSSIAGQFNQRPLTLSELQQLSEYLWQFTSYNNYGNAVLKSSGATANSLLQHTLIVASLTPAASGDCDHVHVVGWAHSVDSQTGGLSLTVLPLWDFGARRAAGIVESCNPT